MEAESCIMRYCIPGTHRLGYFTCHEMPVDVEGPCSVIGLVGQAEVRPDILGDVDRHASGDAARHAQPHPRTTLLQP